MCQTGPFRVKEFKMDSTLMREGEEKKTETFTFSLHYLQGEQCFGSVHSQSTPRIRTTRRRRVSGLIRLPLSQLRLITRGSKEESCVAPLDSTRHPCSGLHMSGLTVDFTSPRTKLDVRRLNTLATGIVTTLRPRVRCLDTKVVEAYLAVRRPRRTPSKTE